MLQTVAAAGQEAAAVASAVREWAAAHPHVRITGEHLAGVGFDVRVYDLARDIVPSLQLLKSPEAWMPGQRSARPGRPGLDRSAACADAHEPVALAAATGVHAASTAVGDRRWPARAGGLGCGSGGGGP
jgi:hypothetical protein